MRKIYKGPEKISCTLKKETKHAIITKNVSRIYKDHINSIKNRQKMSFFNF